jgi:hypothetical protein
MVRIFVQEIIDGWMAAPANNPGLGERGHQTREAAVQAIKAKFQKGTEFEIQDMILGIPYGEPVAPDEANLKRKELKLYAHDPDLNEALQRREDF